MYDDAERRLRRGEFAYISAAVSLDGHGGAKLVGAAFTSQPLFPDMQEIRL